MEILLLSGTVVLSYSLTRREGQEGNFIFCKIFFPHFLWGRAPALFPAYHSSPLPIPQDHLGILKNALARSREIRYNGSKNPLAGNCGRDGRLEKKGPPQCTAVRLQRGCDLKMTTGISSEFDRPPDQGRNGGGDRRKGPCPQGPHCRAALGRSLCLWGKRLLIREILDSCPCDFTRIDFKIPDVFRLQRTPPPTGG